MIAKLKDPTNARNKNGNKIPTESERHGARNGGPLAAPPTSPASVAVLNRARLDDAEASAQQEHLDKFLRLSATSMANRQGNTADVLLVCIAPNPFQPRRDLDQAKLAELAESLKANGLLQRIVLRPKIKAIGAFEIVAGERRWRAAKLAGWSHIPAEIRDYSDQQMQIEALVENDDREDLNPLDRARAYQKILDVRGITPAELEQVVGRSQSFVSNHLRLLKLPKPWQDRVASGEISLTHAREVMPFTKHPKLLAELEKRIKQMDGFAMSASRFQEMIEEEVSYLTEDINQKIYAQNTCTKIPPPKLTDEQREQLAIIELPSPDGKGTEQRATNTKLWNQICAAYQKQFAASEGKPAAAKTKERKLSAAELKARARDQAEQLNRRLSTWKANWLRYLISRRLTIGAKADEETMSRLILWAASDGGFFHKQDLLAEAIEAATGTKLKRNEFYWDRWQGLLGVDDEHLAAVTMAFVRSLLWRKVKGVEQPNNALDDENVFRLARHLKINLAAEWKERKAGPLTEAFYNLFDKAALEQLAKGMSNPADTKSTLVKLLAKVGSNQLPKEIAAVKDPK